MVKRTKNQSRSRRQEVVPSLWRHVFLGVGACLLVLLCATGVWYGTRLPSVTVTSVVVLGGETISKDVVRETVLRELSGSYLKLIPYRFTFFYPKDLVAAAVMQIPRVKDVVVRRENTELTVTFAEYVPYALWCLVSDETAPCSFLDETGFAFSPGPRLQGGALVRHSLESESTLTKKQLFETTSFHEMHAFLARLERELSLRVTDVFYTKEDDVKLMVNGGGELLIRNGESYETVFANLASVLSSKEFKHIEPGNFKYIDLRFGNKIFVNEKMELDAPATTTDVVATSTE